MRRLISGRCLIVFTIALAAVLFAVPSYAQTGRLTGTVVDGAKKPLEKAQIVIEFAGGANRTYKTTSNKKGEFAQAGLAPGTYKVTASYPNLGEESFTVSVRLAAATDVNFVLGGGANLSAEDAAKQAAIKKIFAEGVALSNAGDIDGAISKFTETVTIMPACFDCQYNLGFAYLQKKEYDKAEALFNKTLELNPKYINAYNSLAAVANARKQYDKAEQYSAKAAEIAKAEGGEAGSVDAEYNQGVVLWNAGKIAEAKTHFETVIKLKPDHADAHYQVGMANLNLGALPEAAVMLEKYLQLAPDGQYAAAAKGVIAQIKQ